jgi:endo-alpha-1,4-polygalactosaminidase (GH114 family)
MTWSSFLQTNQDSFAMRSILHFTLLGWAFLFANVDGLTQETVQPNSFVICYNPSVPPEDFAPYPMVVVDYAYPPTAVAELRRRGKIVFGYLSIAKVHLQRPFASDVQSLGIQHDRDPQFPGSVRVNAADPKWRELVVQMVVPKIKRLGFNGIFLDDLDDLKNRKLEQHGVSLIREIRQANPEIKLMANRGLEYLADFAPHVDFVLLESCFVLSGQIRKPADSAWAMDLLNVGKGINPKLQGVAIDYIQKPKSQSTANRKQSLPQSQLRLVARIRELHAKHDLLSCVSTEDLQSVPGF